MSKLYVCKKFMTPEVIRAIIEIDKTFYKEFDYSDCSWYFERYNEQNEAFVLMDNEKIVGYFLFYTITQDLFDDICNLKYEGDYNFPNSEVNVKSNYYYMPSVLILDKYRNKSIQLLLKLKKEIQNKHNVVVITISKEGEYLASKMLEKVGEIKETISVFKKELT